MKFRRSAFLTLSAVCVVFTLEADARMVLGPGTIDDFTQSAARIFRATCSSAEVEVLEIAGGRIPVTIYTFHVAEYLKGGGPATLTFRQVGTPQGGPRDLGSRVGIPVYRPRHEYVLFLLPESRFGLTSPAGAAEAAFEVHGDELRRIGLARGKTGLMRKGVRGSPVRAVETSSYKELRSKVLSLLGQ